MIEVERLKSAVNIYRAFDIRVEINAFIAKVFDALTTAEGLNSWWTDESKSDPREGGQIEYIWRFGDKSVIARAVYRSFNLPHAFEVEFLEWIDEAGRWNDFKTNPYEPPVTHCYQLQEETPTKTRLFLMTSGIKCGEEFDTAYQGTYEGWINSLANLKSVCETGRDLRSELMKSE